MIKTSSALERTFETLWNRHFREIKLEREYSFAKDIGRRFRADFAHLEMRVLIEIEGGIWTQGRHTNPVGYSKDCDKYNLATLYGWKVIRLTQNQLNDDYIIMIGEWIRRGCVVT